MLLLQTLGQRHASGAHARSPRAGLLCPAPAIPARHQRLSQVSSGSVVCLDPEPSFLISWSQFLLLQKNLFVDYLSAAVPLPRGLCFTRRARFLGCESDPGDLCRTHSGFSLVLLLPAASSRSALSCGAMWMSSHSGFFFLLPLELAPVLSLGSVCFVCFPFCAPGRFSPTHFSRFHGNIASSQKPRLVYPAAHSTNIYCVTLRDAGGEQG